MVPGRARAASPGIATPRRARRRRLAAAEAAWPLGRGPGSRLRRERGAGAGTAPLLGRAAGVPLRRFVRGRGRGRLELPLLHLGRGRRVAYNLQSPPPIGDCDLGFGPESDRSGDRVRLLLRPRRAELPRARPRGRDGQLQSRDRLDRLRHLGPPLLRAARRRRGDRRLRARARRRASTSSRQPAASRPAPASPSSISPSGSRPARRRSTT